MEAHSFIRSGEASYLLPAVVLNVVRMPRSCTQTCTYINTQIHTQAQVHLHEHTCTYTQTHTYKDKHTHTHTHTHTPPTRPFHRRSWQTAVRPPGSCPAPPSATCSCRNNRNSPCKRVIARYPVSWSSHALHRLLPPAAAETTETVRAKE